MALRNQPYLPLYVQDYLTDEKLNECSPATQGVYIKLLCVLHKMEEYGTILLKQTDKQSGEQIKNFAMKFAKQISFTPDVIESALTELLENKVITINGDILYQKRMVKDNELSIKRADAGKKGGETTWEKVEFAKAKAKAKAIANSENEYEIENDTNNKRKHPTIEEISAYCAERKNKIDPSYFFDYQIARNWTLKGGNKIKDWKAVIRTWEKNNFTGGNNGSGGNRKHGGRELPPSIEESLDAARAKWLANQATASKDKPNP